jgi:mRNA interferase YafQ
MRQAKTTGQFDRDYMLMMKRGKKIGKLDAAMMLLLQAEPLPPRYRDHALKGGFTGCRDCHVEPDWLLIYKVDSDTVTFIRTGTHSDIFR